MLPLNWVVGNILPWQLLFAGPEARSCFLLTLSLVLSVLPGFHLLGFFSSSLCSSVRSLFEALFLHPFLFVSLFLFVEKKIKIIDL